jgi:protein-S-isoprenylcysteine O-methyltransferase Ste14
VAQGLYRYVRNPMYVSVLLVLLGESVFFESRRLLLYAGIVWLVVHSFVLIYEEPALRRKFGAAYDEYCRRVPRWLPRFR